LDYVTHFTLSSSSIHIKATKPDSKNEQANHAKAIASGVKINAINIWRKTNSQTLNTKYVKETALSFKRVSTVQHSKDAYNGL
jgi:hypothetical protein